MRAFVYLASLLFFIQMPGFAQDRWPPVQPEQKSEKITLPDIDDPARAAVKSTGKTTFDLMIRSSTGVPLYNIECGSPDRSNAKVFEYSGDFQCRMVPAGSEISSEDLLSEVPHRTHDWQSRARFFASEVLGKCGEIVDYGRERTFRLRGMKVTLSMADIQADQSGRVPTLRGFTFQVVVVPDSNATSRIAEAPVPSPNVKSSGCPLDDSVSVHFRK
jgi:hypothetical protein